MYYDRTNPQRRVMARPKTYYRHTPWAREQGSLLNAMPPTTFKRAGSGEIVSRVAAAVDERWAENVAANVLKIPE